MSEDKVENKEVKKAKVVKGKDQPDETTKILGRLTEVMEKLASKPEDKDLNKKVRTLVSKGLDEDMKNVKIKMESDWKSGTKTKVKIEATNKFGTWKLTFPPKDWDVPEKDKKEYISYGDPQEVIINGYHIALPRGAYVTVPESIAEILEEREETIHRGQQELYDKLQEYKSQDPDYKG